MLFSEKLLHNHPQFLAYFLIHYATKMAKHHFLSYEHMKIDRHVKFAPMPQIFTYNVHFLIANMISDSRFRFMFLLNFFSPYRFAINIRF